MKKFLKILAIISCILCLSACASSDTEGTSENTTNTSMALASFEDGTFKTEESAAEISNESTQKESMEEFMEKPKEKSGEKITIEASTDDEISEMQVHFIDVGQGDATLITCDGEAMLIDAGDNSKGTTVQLYLSKQGVKELKYLILTHPDADHIGGADVIVTKFDIDNVFMSDYLKDNKTYEELTRALDDKGLKGITPNVGNTYTLGSAEFTILAPNTTYSDPNNSSIGLLLKNGDDAFLFTGDAEEEAEYDILANGLDLDCDVYKAGHHGSKTASSQYLLEAASPTYVVVSCAEGNSYGHPHAEPMNNFRSMGMKLFRTDEQGSIVATSNGTEITWNCAPTESWVAGESTASSAKSKTQTSSVEEKAPVQADITPQPVTEPEVVQEPTPTPEVIQEPATVPEPAADVMVWQSATGKKYHSINDCGNMNPDKAKYISKTEAESKGLGPCSKCW